MQEFGVGLLVALLAFVGFPALRYSVLRRLVGSEARPQLWYLPDYGFRLVARNLPRKHTLTGLRVHVFLRKHIPKSEGASVGVNLDTKLREYHNHFLFGGTDQVLLAFRIEGEDPAELWLVDTDTAGAELGRVPLSKFKWLVADFSATVKGWLGFDPHLAFRAKISSSDLADYWQDNRKDNQEGLFPVSDYEFV